VEVYPGFAGKEVLYDWHGAVVGVATGGGVEIEYGNAEAVFVDTALQVHLQCEVLWGKGGRGEYVLGGEGGWLCLAVEAGGSSSEVYEVHWTAAADGSLTAQVLQSHFEIQSKWLLCP